MSQPDRPAYPGHESSAFTSQRGTARRPFRNEIDAELAGRHLIGEWRNTSDTRYYGTMQLAVLPGEIVMEGYYAGVGSDVEVSTGLLAVGPARPGSTPGWPGSSCGSRPICTTL